MSPRRCPTHRYTGAQEPTVSCPTCWALWVWNPEATTPDEHARIWAKINAKGMRIPVQQALVSLYAEKR